MHLPSPQAHHQEGAVKRATTKCNLICNIAAKRVEQRCCAFYHPQENTLQPYLLWMVKRATSLFNSFCGIVAKQVALFCCSFYCGVNPNTFIQIRCIHFRQTADSKSPDTRPNRDVFISDSRTCRPGYLKGPFIVFPCGRL